MVNVFIPQSIRDKATRDVLNKIIQIIDGGVGNASISMSANDPLSTDPGQVGDIIYSNDTENIWIFTGSAWEKATSSDGLSVYITTDSGTVFKNSVGTPKILTANVNLGGVTPSDTDYNSYNYDWTYEGNTICLTNDGSRTVISTNGIPNTVNGSGVCALGVPANSADSAAIAVSLNTGVLRSIVVGPEDVNTQIRIAVSVIIGE